MKSAKFDKAASDAIAQAVREIEKKTDAEVVIVIRGRSGSYRQADYLCGAILAFLGLLFVLFSPFDFHTYWVPFDVAVLFAIGAFACSRTYLLRRLFTTKKFRTQVARQGAAAMFYEAGIANTHAENGMLIYVSLLEQQVEVIADRGVLKAMPPLKWNTAIHELKQMARRCEPEKLTGCLRNLGSILAEHLPATGENPNELVDGPRIELK
jgi:putative membrane protein